MADIFISYSRPDRAVIQALAEDLAKAGASVWWDRELLAGDPYHKLIPAEITACRVAIVLWTSHSIHSEWVLSEVRRAGDKLIQLGAAGITQDDVPPPFDVRHIDRIDDRPAIAAALRRRGLDLHLDGRARPRPPWWRTRRALFGTAGVALGAAGLGWYATRPEQPVDWTTLPTGTTFANLSLSVVASYEEPSRTAGRSVDLRAGQVVPAAGTDDRISRATVGGEAWLRFPVGDGRSAHVPEIDVKLRSPR